MKLNKITTGFVTQVYDTETKQYDGQYFTASDEVAWEDDNGNDASQFQSILKDVRYLPFEMEQPNILCSDAATQPPRSGQITYRQLYDWIGRMNHEQLQSSVIVHIAECDELVPVYCMVLNDAEQDDDRLDDGHPILGINHESD